MSYAWRDPARITPARLAELEARDRPEAADDRYQSLAARIRQFGRLRAAGYRISEAAREMGISRDTVTGKRDDMSLIHVPQAAHGCGISWETYRSDDGQNYLREVNRWDAPGTVRQCGECGKFWVAEQYPEVHYGMQSLGVFWRPEKRRERRRRQRQS